MIRGALIAALLLTGIPASAQVGALPGPPVPPPPPPPPIVRNPALREALDKVGGFIGWLHDDGRFAAVKATEGLKATPGSPEWEAARQVVLRYVQGRMAEKQCLLDLDTFRINHYVPPDDRKILIDRLQGHVDFWLGQSERELQVLAALVESGIDTKPGSLVGLHH